MTEPKASLRVDLEVIVFTFMYRAWSSQLIRRHLHEARNAFRVVRAHLSCRERNAIIHGYRFATAVSMGLGDSSHRASQSISDPDRKINLRVKGASPPFPLPLLLPASLR